jgi:hypothetical protein
MEEHRNNANHTNGESDSVDPLIALNSIKEEDELFGKINQLGGSNNE